MRYAQHGNKMGFFINMTMVFLPSGLVGDPPWASSVSGGGCRDRIPGLTTQNWQGRGIIPDTIATKPLRLRTSDLGSDAYNRGRYNVEKRYSGHRRIEPSSGLEGRQAFHSVPVSVQRSCTNGG